MFLLADLGGGGVSVSSSMKWGLQMLWVEGPEVGAVPDRLSSAHSSPAQGPSLRLERREQKVIAAASGGSPRGETLNPTAGLA